MSYEKHTWETGETITAEKLNNLEDGIDNIDLGYKINTNTTILFEGNVTTEINDGIPLYEFESNLNINANKIYVTFNDVEYIVEAIVDNQFTFFGEIDSTSNRGPIFTTYPFLIMKINNGSYLLATMNEGTYYLKIEIKNTNMETTEDFDAAVNQVINNQVVNNNYIIETENMGSYYNTIQTAQEILEAYESGKQLWVSMIEDNGYTYSKAYYAIKKILIYYSDEEFSIIAGIELKIENTNSSRVSWHMSQEATGLDYCLTTMIDTV